MKVSTLSVLTAVCGAVAAHTADEEVPVHNQEFVQDDAQELERKWGFEVCGFSGVPV
jgi:hypothetical protein